MLFQLVGAFHTGGQFAPCPRPRGRNRPGYNRAPLGCYAKDVVCERQPKVKRTLIRGPWPIKVLSP